MLRRLSKRVRTIMDTNWPPAGIPGRTAININNSNTNNSSRSTTDGGGSARPSTDAHQNNVTHQQRNLSGRDTVGQSLNQTNATHQQRHTVGQTVYQSDGAFERFLTAAIATIITIMFSWRMLDQSNKPTTSSSSSFSSSPSSSSLLPRLPAGRRHTEEDGEDDDDEEEKRKRREKCLRGGQTSENLFTASSSPSTLLFSSPPPSSSSSSAVPLSDRGGSNMSPVSSSSSSSSSSTPTNSSRRRQLPVVPGSQRSADVPSLSSSPQTQLSPSSSSSPSSSPSLSRFQQQQGESLASRLAKISSSTSASARGRTPGFRLTNLSPVIRVPVDNFPLCGEETPDPEATPKSPSDMDTTERDQRSTSPRGNSPKQLSRQDTPHPNPGTIDPTGVISETLVDPTQLSALGLDPWSIGKTPPGVTGPDGSRKGPVLYTDLDADSSEELVDSSLEDAESAAGIGDPGKFGSNNRVSGSGGAVCLPRRDLLLNVSTDSDSSGGLITRDPPHPPHSPHPPPAPAVSLDNEDEDEEIVDPRHFHAVMTAKMKEGEEDRRSPRRLRHSGGEEEEEDYDNDNYNDDDDDEFFVVPGDSSYRHHHHYSGQRSTTSNNISALGGGGEGGGYHGNNTSPTRGGIVGFPSYYYEDEEEDYDDVQPRELDSDEELYLCSVLEPIIEENSDDLSPSSGAESYSSTSSSSRGGYRARHHQQHDYDVDYVERKHGLTPDPALTQGAGGSSTTLTDSTISLGLSAADSLHNIHPIETVLSEPSLRQADKTVDDRTVLSPVPPNRSQQGITGERRDYLTSSTPSISLYGDNNKGVIRPEKGVDLTSDSGDSDNNKNTTVAEGGRAGSDLNFTSNASLIMGIKATYTIPNNTPRSNVMNRTDRDPSDLTERAERGDLPSPTLATLSASRFTDSTARAAGERQVRGGEAGGDTATHLDTALLGDTHTLTSEREGGWGSGDYNESKASFGDAGTSLGSSSAGFTQHIPSAATTFTTSVSSGSETNTTSSVTDGFQTTPVQINPVNSNFATGLNSGNGLRKSVTGVTSSSRPVPLYRSRPDSNGSNLNVIHGDLDLRDNVNYNNNNNNNNSDSSTSSSSNNGEKTISYKFYSDVNSGVYSSRIIITGEKEEEVKEPSILEDLTESDTGELNCDLHNTRPSEAALACDELSVSFPSDSDYYDYLRCYGSSVDLDSPTSPRSPTNLCKSPVNLERTKDLNRDSGNSQYHPDSKYSEGESGEERQHSGVLANFRDGEREGGSRGVLRRQDHQASFARTFSTRVDHDSNSESDESVQTIISRKGSKASDPATTSSSSTGSSHQTSPVHVPLPSAGAVPGASLSPPSVSRPKRPLSEGCVYAASKVPREDEGRDAFYRDRIVSEGGGVAFGEEGIADDRFEGGEPEGFRRESEGEGDRGFHLRAYKSYSALDTKGLDLHSDEDRESRSGVFSDSECSSPSSPYIPRASTGFDNYTEPALVSNSPGSLGHEGLDADVINQTTVTFDGADSLTFVVKPQDIPDTDMDRPRFRVSREEEEAYRYGARSNFEERRVPEISEQRPHADQGTGDNGGDDEEDEWEQSITETFVVPVTPERSIYQALQNVKHLLDTRSPSLEQDEAASTCTTTMVEADGRNIGGFLGHEDVTSGYRERSDALERVDASLKERLGFRLNMDELRSEGYSTESGWPIVRYIEKERVFIQEHGVDNNYDNTGKEGVDSGDEYVPDYTDIDADNEYLPRDDDDDDEAGAPMQEDTDIPGAHKPVPEDFTHQHSPDYLATEYPESPSIPWQPATTIAAPSYSQPPSRAPQSPGFVHSLASPKSPGELRSPRPGRLGSSRSNLPPPPPPPTHSRGPGDRYTAPQRSAVETTRPGFGDTHYPLASPETEAPPLPHVPHPSQPRVPPHSPIYPSGPQPSLLPEEEDFAYLPHSEDTNFKSVISPESIPVQHSSPPSVPSALPHSSYTLLDAPPRVIRPPSSQPPDNQPTLAPHEQPCVEASKQPHTLSPKHVDMGDDARQRQRHDSSSSEGSDTRGRPSREFGDPYSSGEEPDGDEDYDYFVKHIADEEPESSGILTSGNLKTPLSAASSGGLGIPILSGNIASPYAKTDVFQFPSEGSSPTTKGHPSSKTHSSPSYAAASGIPASLEPRYLDEAKAEKRGAGEGDEEQGDEERADESSPKKPKMGRTSTGTEAMGGFFSAPRRSSAASLLDDDSSNALNRSFGEPSNSSLSFALERYDSEPGMRSPTKEKFSGSFDSPFRESPVRMNSRPMSFISQEPTLDVVMEARVDPTHATVSSASSTASDVTVVPARSPHSPPLSPSAGISLEESPTLTAPPHHLQPPLSLPPFSTSARAPGDPTDSADDIPSTPGESESLILSEMDQRWDNNMKRVKKNKMDIKFADDDKDDNEFNESRDSAALISPPVERDQIAQLATKSPRIDPIFAEKQNRVGAPHIGGGDNKGVAGGNRDPGLSDSDVTDDEGEEEDESEDNIDSKPANNLKFTEDRVSQRDRDARPIILQPVVTGIRPVNLRDHRRIPLRAGSNSVESLDENYPAESPPSSGPMSPGISSDSASAVEASPSTSSSKANDAASLVAPPLQAVQRPTQSRISSSSPSGLSTLGQSSPLCIPFPGTAWAHAQFGQYDKPPKPPQPTTPKRSMREVKKMSKSPYKSVLTQNPPPSFTTPPSPTPKAAAFVLPDSMITPSRMKIMNSRNRFLSEGSLQNAEAQDFKNEFEAHKESLLQSQGDISNSSIPAGSRLYTPKSQPDSFNAKNWRYRSMEQLQKLQEMSRMTRKSESDLSSKDKGSHDCLHPDCIFSEKGRREVLDKTLSIDNLHADVYKHLRRLGGSESDAGDAYFPENSSDLIDLTFNNFQNATGSSRGPGDANFDRPQSMSELRHASDYSTISGSGYFSTPNSARHSTGKGAGRFSQHKQYKKSKSLCTLETDIDDESFGPTSPSSPGGDGGELGMQRAPSAHDLRISKSLQKLNVPQWYSQSSLAKYGSLSLLKYGSNSTMNSWQQFPSSLISSPCTTPSASGNVVIKARVQAPTSARNLRSPRFPSKSAPTTPLFGTGTNGHTTPQRSGESPSVKLPSDKLRSKDKAKALMPIPIVPFDKIRAMFEKKKNEEKAAKQTHESPSPLSPTSPVTSPINDKSPSPTVATPLCFSPPPTAASPSQYPPRSLALNGRRNLRDEEDDVYEDVEIVVPKVIVSPTEPHVKGILKRPSQSEKRYSDIQEDEEDEEQPIPRPVPTRPVETAPSIKIAQPPQMSAPPQAQSPQSPISEPQVDHFFNRHEDPIHSQPAPQAYRQPTQPPAQSPPPRANQEPSHPIPDRKEATSPKPPTPKPRSSGFSFFKKKLSIGSSSSSEKGSKKSPKGSPANSGSPNTSYDSADKFPVPSRPGTQPPDPRAQSPGSNDYYNNGPRSSDSSYPASPTETSMRLEEAPALVRPPHTVTFHDEDPMYPSSTNHDVFPASSSTLPPHHRQPDPWDHQPGHIQETNIDDSSEGSVPTSPSAHIPVPYLQQYQLPPQSYHPQQLHQTPPEPPSSSPPPLATSSSPPPATTQPVPEPAAKPEKPEKKRTWFPKSGRSRRTSKSPAPSTSDHERKELPSPQSPQQTLNDTPPGFQVEEMSYEPRRLRSSRSSGLDESFTSESSRAQPSRGFPLGSRPDLERSRDNLRASRPVNLERKSSVESDRSFSRDLDRVTGRAAARAAPLDLDRSGGSSGGAGSVDKRELSFRERRDRDLRHYESDLDDYNHNDPSRRDNRRDPYSRDIDSDSSSRRDKNLPERSSDREPIVPRGRDRDDPRRYDMDTSASSASLAPRDRRSRELPDVDTSMSRRSLDHVDLGIKRADRQPYVIEDAPPKRTWQPKSRASRNQPQPQPISALSQSQAPPLQSQAPPKTNGTTPGNYRYPVSGSAFSSSKPNQPPGLNTPPMSRHPAPNTAQVTPSPEEEADKSVRETTV